jgi:hypothetical protein
LGEIEIEKASRQERGMGVEKREKEVLRQISAGGRMNEKLCM